MISCMLVIMSVSCVSSCRSSCLERMHVAIMELLVDEHQLWDDQNHVIHLAFLSHYLWEEEDTRMGIEAG